ncbi:prepilin-type N-terminal cleavage/methylation domain-containing protein [Candidatus Parcubacteria bacterium]|nr:prepilin-type N-terminal cleavage/methylation domain-containing protein [Candidatus Parcubacteria bacterium]
MKNIFQGKKNNQKGFTLVELMVVVGIIAVISALSLFNSSKLNSSVLLSNTAYEIGLIIRDAQVSGLGAKVLLNGGNATTSNQGVFFDKGTPEKIVFFADLDKNNTYNSGEESQVYNIENKRAGSIIRICEVNGTNCDDMYDLTVMFKRPNPEAYFYDTDHTSIGIQSNVVINVGFDGGDCRSIIIYKTGAIQIDKSYCPPATN